VLATCGPSRPALTTDRLTNCRKCPSRDAGGPVSSTAAPTIEFDENPGIDVTMAERRIRAVVYGARAMGTVASSPP
jgi:hypothetical protein